LTDWGAVSSWVAAGISVTVFGAGTARAWWNRPQVDWALSGELGWPNYSDPEAKWLQGKLALSNFGDGPAHRVSVHIQRSHYKAGVLATAPLLKPGDALEFETGVHAEDFKSTHVWATWTAPPIRRRRERTSQRLAISEQVTLTTIATRKFAELEGIATDL
jgi:hypothetical protein